MKNLSSILPGIFLLWALFLPWSLSGMQVFLILSVLVTIFIKLSQKQSPFALDEFAILFVIYLALRILSALLSPKPSVSISAVFHTDWPLLSIPILSSICMTPQNRKKILQSLIFSSATISIYALYQFFSGFDPYRGKILTEMGNFYRSTGAFDFYLTLAGTQLMIFFVALGLLKSAAQSKVRKIVLAISALLIFLSILTTFGRSAWIALLVAGAIGLALSSRRILRKGLIVAIPLIVLVTLAIPELRERLFSSFDLSANSDRLNLWKTSAAMIADRPLLGIGPGLFKENFEKYKVPGNYDATGHAHNDYLNLAATSGILSLLAWLFMWGYWFKRTIKTSKSLPPDSVDRLHLLGISLSLIAILFASLFQCYYTDLENNICWTFLAVMGLQITRQPESSPA
jgi:O-antigen ligase